MKTPLRLACASLVMLFSLVARAATIVWANVGSSWPTSANWVAGVAPNDSTTTDIASFGTGTVVNPSLSAQAQINSV